MSRKINSKQFQTINSDFLGGGWWEQLIPTFFVSTGRRVCSVFLSQKHQDIDSVPNSQF